MDKLPRSASHPIRMWQRQCFEGSVSLFFLPSGSPETCGAGRTTRLGLTSEYGFLIGRPVSSAHSINDPAYGARGIGMAHDVGLDVLHVAELVRVSMQRAEGRVGEKKEEGTLVQSSRSVYICLEKIRRVRAIYVPTKDTVVSQYC